VRPWNAIRSLALLVAVRNLSKKAQQ